MRSIMDAILYVLRAGGAWHLLPREFPPWGTVYRWFACLARAGTFERLAYVLTMLDRERAGRDASPTAAVIDAQSVRSGGVGVAGARGYDAAKKVVGRKRHIMVDTGGRLMMTTGSSAGVHDSHGGTALLPASRHPWPFLERCFADKAYAGERVAKASPITVEVIGAAPGQRGFAVQPRRWVVERTFAWIGRCRRLARDHEATISSGVAFTTLAAAMILVRRIARGL
jgi:putative transposase